MKRLSFVLALIAAIILLQTLFFKFSAAPTSVWIFSQLGAEPIGRIGTGVIELITSVLLMWTRFRWLGALLALGTMSGALLAHLTVLGIAVQGDGGQVFALGVITWLCAAGVLWLERKQLPLVGARF